MVSKNFLSVRPSVINFDPNYLGTGRAERAEIIFTKFARLAARAVFVRLFLLQKQLIYDFFGRKYPNSPYWQGGMKFAAPISPLLNCSIRIDRCVSNALFLNRIESRLLNLFLQSCYNYI